MLNTVGRQCCLASSCTHLAVRRPLSASNVSSPTTYWGSRLRALCLAAACDTTSHCVWRPRLLPCTAAAGRAGLAAAGAGKAPPGAGLWLLTVGPLAASANGRPLTSTEAVGVVELAAAAGAAGAGSSTGRPRTSCMMYLLKMDQSTRWTTREDRSRTCDTCDKQILATHRLLHCGVRLQLILGGPGPNVATLGCQAVAVALSLACWCAPDRPRTA